MRLRNVGFRRASFQELWGNLPLWPPATPTVGHPVSSFPFILNFLTEWVLITLSWNPDVQDTLCAELQSRLGETDDSAYSQLVNALTRLPLRSLGHIPIVRGGEMCGCGLCHL